MGTNNITLSHPEPETLHLTSHMQTNSVDEAEEWIHALNDAATLNLKPYTLHPSPHTQNAFADADTTAAKVERFLHPKQRRNGGRKTGSNCSRRVFPFGTKLSRFRVQGLWFRRLGVSLLDFDF